MQFLSLNPEAFGLDISDLCLRVAKLKKRGRFFDLASWGEIKLGPGIIRQGEIKEEDKLAENIQKLLAKLKGEKIKTKYVNASLPEKKAFLQVIQVPKMEQEELATAIPFEAENYVPLPIEQVYLDFQIVPPFSHQGAKLDILIAALPKKTIDPYISVLKKAGLIPKALEVESQSIVRALIKKELSSSPVFIIDFGKSTTSVIVFSRHSIRFTSSIAISFQELSNGKKQKIILAEEVKKCIDYYHTHNGKITQILLCGQGANLKGLTDFISSELKIPTELANPWTNILPESIKKIPKISFKESLGYTTALGLALRGVKE